ncbi:TonB family C-terminal domain-containing protein [Bryocella elongata]|uniref:TonB family C-terminal domain-containing protein n=1 Tax=Bryocella elongata TaxID=863522 RepID=A0A1H5YN17_9BACT|nr:energy transducer TonB [Bryocella elongata]SEG25150.1 TonB family C-terminal domain-containing protein [Bryocella elongata]
MRRILASALALLPALASAQVPANPMVAMLHLPVVMFAVPNGAMGAPVKATVDASSLMVPVVQTVVKNADQSAFTSAGTLTTAPKLIRSVPITLSLEDMRTEATHAVVVVRLTVDATGKLANLSIVRSAGAAVDRRALEAVKQYTFEPAKEGGVAVPANVTVSIDLKKS